MFYITFPFMFGLKYKMCVKKLLITLTLLTCNTVKQPYSGFVIINTSTTQFNSIVNIIHDFTAIRNYYVKIL